MPMTLYAATSNRGKLDEFAASASTANLTVLTLPGLGDMPEPVEDAHSFMGNAEKKAVAYSRLAPGLLVMADDSGLEVEALGGEPGVRSARYWEDSRPVDRRDSDGEREAGAPGRDARNNALLLERMAGVAEGERGARFVCALAVARDGAVVWRAEGEVRGEILREARGASGFGYDPLFLVAEVGLTMAEMAPEMKWEWSHRGRAFRRLLAELCA